MKAMFKTDNFDKNFKVMNDTGYAELKKELKKLKKLNFEFEFDPFEQLNVNIIDKKSGQRLYEEPFKELKEGLKPFEKDYQRYPYLCFYGIGNGLLYKVLLQNETHRRIVVFEPNIELIYMALNLVDFVEAIYKGRLIIVHTKQYRSAMAELIFGINEIKLFSRLYNLHIHSAYYEENFAQDLMDTNTINANAIHSLDLKAGNDPRDALMGIEHYMINLPKMLARPTLNELIKKRKKKGKFAVLVATGPSLTKQLPLLKKYAKKATIFCADSSYTILQQNDIKPDYVLSLERVSKTSEFFNNDFGEFDKDIIFLIYTLTHPNTVKYLEQNKRNFIITQRALPFAAYLGFLNYGAIGGGMSVMNMAYQFAEMLGFKNIVFIGQDLAYAENGASHAKNYKHDEFFESNMYNKIETQAYGGVGKVKTSIVWKLFREIFEGYIFANKKRVKSYNCTEGGARIEGSIEKPFKELCEEFLAKQPDKKPLPKPAKPTRKQSGEYMLKAYKLIKDGQNYTANYLKACKKVQRQLNSLIYGKQNCTLDAINSGIDKLKKRLESRKALFCYEILSPPFTHQEAALAPLYAKHFENETDRQNKLLMWLYAHEAWVEELIDLLEVFEASMKVHIVPLREELERRKLL